MNNNTNNILFAILSILVIQFIILFSNEIRFSRLEHKIDQYFAPIEDVELPQWEEQR